VTIWFSLTVLITVLRHSLFANTNYAERVADIKGKLGVLIRESYLMWDRIADNEVSYIRDASAAANVVAQ
jgi:hypothetical protein